MVSDENNSHVYVGENNCRTMLMSLLEVDLSMSDML